MVIQFSKLFIMLGQLVFQNTVNRSFDVVSEPENREKKVNSQQGSDATDRQE
jgi:hypothetical protein